MTEYDWFQVMLCIFIPLITLNVMANDEFWHRLRRWARR